MYPFVITYNTFPPFLINSLQRDYHKYSVEKLRKQSFYLRVYISMTQIISWRPSPRNTQLRRKCKLHPRWCNVYQCNRLPRLRCDFEFYIRDMILRRFVSFPTRASRRSARVRVSGTSYFDRSLHCDRVQCLAFATRSFSFSHTLNHPRDCQDFPTRICDI